MLEFRSFLPLSTGPAYGWSAALAALPLLLGLTAARAEPPESVVKPVVKSHEPAAFEAAIDQELPLTPDEIRAFRRQFDANRRAAAAPSGRPPKPRTSSVTVSLQPGADIPTILVYEGLFSSLCFLDKSGQPWPIQTYSGAGETDRLFHVTQPQPHILDVSPKAGYRLANLSVTLAGLPTPVSVNLVLGSPGVHDSRKDIHIDACGPLCKDVAGPPEPGLNQALYDLLDGIPPTGARQLKVTGSASTAIWARDGHYYVRTGETLLSPACLPHQQARSMDGTRACILPEIPALRVSRDGRPAVVRVE